MTLIDTPGTNDIDRKRKKEIINIDIMSTVRPQLSSETAGMTSFTQCIQPDAGGRIKESAIDSMCNIILSLTSME